MQHKVLAAMLVALLIVVALASYLFFGAANTLPAAEAAAPTIETSAERDDTVPLRAPENGLDDESVASAVREEPAAQPQLQPAAVREHATTLTGRFLDQQGQPIAAVHVERLHSKFAGSADSDTSGRFELAVGVSASANDDGAARTLNYIHLLATCDGYGTRRLDFTELQIGAATDVGDLVLVGGGAISGRVVDGNGAGFPHALVKVTNLELNFITPDLGPHVSLVDGVCDASGVFRLAGVPAGSVRVWAGIRDTPWVESPAFIVPERGEVFDLLLTVPTLDPKDTIGLRVIDPRGAPVRGATIQFGYAANGSGAVDRSRTDADGRCTLRLKARVPHFIEAVEFTGVLRPARASGVAAGTLDLVLQMSEGPKLVIAVRTQAGLPLGAFEVYAREVPRPALAGAATDVAPRQGWLQPWKIDGDAPHKDGRVELVLPLESFKVTVQAAGYATAELGPFEPSTVPPLIEFVLAESPCIRGVVTAGGKPAREAKVTLHRENLKGNLEPADSFAARYRWNEAALGTTDAKGEFTLNAPESGTYWLRAKLGGWAPADIGPLAFDSTIGLSELVLELSEGGTVEGQVLVAAGSSPLGVQVDASRGDARPLNTRTNAEGRFRFTGLTPGRWWVGSHAREIALDPNAFQAGADKVPPEIRWNCTVKDGETTEFDVPGPLPVDHQVHLRGRLTRGGQPVAGWRVALLSPGFNMIEEPQWLMRLDAEGRFTASGAEPGEYKLQFVDEEHYRFGEGISVLTDLAPGDNVWDLDLALGRIEGVVSPTRMTPQLQIHWTRTGDDRLNATGRVQLDAEGAFALERVPAGHIRFDLSTPEPPAARREQKDFELKVGTTLRIEL